MSCKTCNNRCFENFKFYITESSKEMPFYYVSFFYEYTSNGMIKTNEDNSKVMLKYIKENIDDLDRVCYFDIALQISNLNKYCDIGLTRQNLVHFWMDYLYCAFGDPDDENNQLLKLIEIKRKDRIKNKYSIAVTKVRNNQGCFRDELLKIHRECQICGLKNEKLLVASHLKPYKDCSDEESADIYNGLLLCSGHDKPFDIGLITFDEDGKILISKELSDNDIKRLNIDENTRINLLEDNIKYIKWHKNEVFVDNKKTSKK